MQESCRLGKQERKELRVHRDAWSWRAGLGGDFCSSVEEDVADPVLGMIQVNPRLCHNQFSYFCVGEERLGAWNAVWEVKELLGAALETLEAEEMQKLCFQGCERWERE